LVLECVRSGEIIDWEVSLCSAGWVMTNACIRYPVIWFRAGRLNKHVVEHFYIYVNMTLIG
jgi:hypothetical protein